MSPTPSTIPEESLKVEVSTQDGATLVRCVGKIIAGTTDILYSEVRPLIPHARNIVLDLKDVTKLDSMGLGTLVKLYVSAKSSGSQLQLVHLSQRVRELLGMTNLLSVFEVCGEHRFRM